MKSLLITPVLTLLASLSLSTAAQAMSSGQYSQKLADGSSDVLTINPDNSMSLETTRQVGGPGGISNEGVVPYPTECRTKEWGHVMHENSREIQFRVLFVHLTDESGLSDTKNCQRYVDEFNGRALTSNMNFTIEKAGFAISK